MLVKTSQLIFSIYYQRFRKVLRLLSPDIAEDDNQKSQSKKFQYQKRNCKIEVYCQSKLTFTFWTIGAGPPCGGTMRRTRSSC